MNSALRAPVPRKVSHTKARREKARTALKEKVVTLAKSLRQGDPTGDVDVGACTFPPQVDKIRALLQDAVEKGAVLETGAIPESGARFGLIPIQSISPKGGPSRSRPFFLPRNWRP
jgi:hypothetical protein